METYTTTQPPRALEANRRLLPHVLDEVAAAEPEAPWGEIPVSPTSYDGGYRIVTWKALANAINGLAGLLHEKVGRGNDFETLCYIGPSDPRYPMMVLASIKAGYKAFLDSPRNSIAAHRNLFEQLKCRTIVTTSPPPPAVTLLQHHFSEMKVIHIPSLEALLSTVYPHYPYNKTFEEARSEPMFCLHTSGSTGLPKPIVYPHEFVTTTVNISQLPPPEGYDSLNYLIAGNRCVLLLPLFHIAGMYFSLFMSIMSRTTIVFPLSNAPSTGSSLGAILKHVTADWAFVAPMHAEEIAKHPNLLETVSSGLKMILYSGGSLPTELGDMLASRIQLCSYMGSSEFAGFPHLLPKGTARRDCWAFIHLHPHILADFEDRGEGYAELVIRRDDKHKPWQTPFILFPELQEYHTKDIFKPHPSLPNAWAHQGRNDDIIVFLNGEKTNPTTFEATVNEHPKVLSALVFGNQRTEAGILIELQNADELTTETEQGLKDSIYVKIEEANAVTPAHARISKTHILFAAPDKPFLRASKGTVQRQTTLKSYDDAIRTLYEAADDAVEAPSSTAMNIDSHAPDATEIPVNGRDTDFFSAGLDSLQSLRLARQLRKQLKRSDIEPPLIYAHPSVKDLAQALSQSGRIAAPGNAPPLDPVQSVIQEHVHYIEILASCINEPSSAANGSSGSGIDERQVVLLTGSTGFLGGYLVDCLIADPKILHVYCLDRRLAHGNPSSRVTHLIADLQQPTNFGLAPRDYQHLARSVTRIIHAAWPVDFAQPLLRFRQSLASTTHLLLFAARAARKPAFLYLSSIAAVMNMKNTNEVVPSSLPSRTDVPEKGYGESKLVAEHLVHQAAQRFAISAGIARLGQISGPRSSAGGWNLREWFPRLVQTSGQLHVIPQSLGQMADALDWIPVDDVAPILVELSDDISVKRRSGDAAVFNVINTTSCTWPEVIGTIQRIIGGAEAVDGQVWLERLRNIDEDIEKDAKAAAYEQLVQKYPSLPLENFYRELFNDKYPLRMDSQATKDASSAMRNLQPINIELIGRWIKGIIAQKAV